MPTGAYPVAGAAPLNEGQRLLTRRYGLIRRWMLHHPTAVNAMLAAANILGVGLMTIAGVASERVFSDGDPQFLGSTGWILIVTNLVFSGLIFLRHRFPFLLMVIALVMETVMIFATNSNSNSVSGFTTWIFLYTVASLRNGKTASLAYTVLMVFYVLFGAVDFQRGFKNGVELSTGGVPNDENFWELLLIYGIGLGFIAMFNLVVLMAGRSTRKNRLFDQEVLKHFEQTQTLAATEERTRIAREMHDVVAHSLTVMIALADGARIVSKKNPERAEEVLGELSSTGRSALADMRRTLGVLRDPAGDHAPLAPAEGRAEDAATNLAELVESFASTGLPVTFEHQGETIPADHNLRLSLYRIVQESLTNALRYGRDVSKVQVTVNVKLPDIWVTVINDGTAALTASPKTSGLSGLGSGKGLAGMRERVAFYDGSVRAGENDVGGWTVRAHLRWSAEKPAGSS
ncbi:histidine kinase [Rothia sp. LK2588]|uniref:sensor histidine kinase n=1 Tax=Rothia sp. LK2588 TaxID=3114369 RepID=UPI0034CE2C1E